jgi:hypothetical protein
MPTSMERNQDFLLGAQMKLEEVVDWIKTIAWLMIAGAIFSIAWKMTR